jgi:hypothetical protein
MLSLFIVSKGSAGKSSKKEERGKRQPQDAFHSEPH